jgi:hypothetical protein
VYFGILWLFYDHIHLLIASSYTINCVLCFFLLRKLAANSILRLRWEYKMPYLCAFARWNQNRQQKWDVLIDKLIFILNGKLGKPSTTPNECWHVQIAHKCAIYQLSSHWKFIIELRVLFFYQVAENMELNCAISRLN